MHPQAFLFVLTTILDFTIKFQGVVKPLKWVRNNEFWEIEV